MGDLNIEANNEAPNYKELQLVTIDNSVTPMTFWTSNNHSPFLSRTSHEDSHGLWEFSLKARIDPDESLFVRVRLSFESRETPLPSFTQWTATFMTKDHKLQPMSMIQSKWIDVESITGASAVFPDDVVNRCLSKNTKEFAFKCVIKLRLDMARMESKPATNSLGFDLAAMDLGSKADAWLIGSKRDISNSAVHTLD